MAQSTVVAQEGLQGAQVVKSFGREAHETQRYVQAMDQTLRPSLRVALQHNLFVAFINFLSLGVVAAIIWFGGREVIAGRLNVAMITGFLIYAVAISSSLGVLSTFFGQLSAVMGASQRIFELLDI